MKKLYKFSWDLYYASCDGLFISTDEDVKTLIGKRLYFGEIEGKHSEVTGNLEESEITLVSDDPAFVRSFETIVGIDFGYNPFEYVSEDGY